MATYAELHSLESDNALTQKTQVAVTIAAYDLVKTGTTPTAAQSAWASAVLQSPIVEAKKALRFVLAKNSGADMSVITTASDATIQTNVNEVVPSLVAAFGG
jgi:NAD/NADP transhydrogenase beta subunit